MGSFDALPLSPTSGQADEKACLLPFSTRMNCRPCKQGFLTLVPPPSHNKTLSHPPFSGLCSHLGPVREAALLSAEASFWIIGGFTPFPRVCVCVCVCVCVWRGEGVIRYHMLLFLLSPLTALLRPPCWSVPCLCGELGPDPGLRPQMARLFCLRSLPHDVIQS